MPQIFHSFPKFIMVVISEIFSSSSSTPDYVYDVFLSFRGYDTRFSFTDHLYNALVNANITTFLDDEEIETGLSLKAELETAIKTSRVSIIVLSQNYASSTWCLNELVLILEQHRNSNHIVVPIFYHVEPTVIRKQQSSFGEAMGEHKQRMETEINVEKRSQWAQKIDLWSKALTEVANLKGEIAKGRKETELIDKIVADIHRKLGVPLNNTLPPLIGMYYDIDFITSWLNDGSSHTGDILTIWGMGGIGKTSLAEYVFRLHSQEFQRSSFVADISRKCAEKSVHCLICKNKFIMTFQKQVWFKFIVFLVLDDVDNIDHLDALLGKKGFHPGSKIIITTKDVSLTKKCQVFYQMVQPKHTMHLLQGLDDYKSLQLLSVWAFKRISPKEGYEEVSDTLVKYCGGHPLALKVLGRSLCNRDVAVWKDCIERLKEEPDSCIKNVLQMSIDSLPSAKDKELFKHIACFFVGENRESTEIILMACGVHTVLGIENLIDRCLLWISWDNKLMMHQLLQEIGRDIVRQESPNMPEKQSRLWRHEESFKVLKQKKGKGNILGLALDMRMLEKDKLHELEMDALSKMDNLMLLQLNHVHQLKGSYKNFPEELRWLCMHGSTLEYIPLDLQLENLVVLDMSYSRLVSFDMSYSDPQRHENRQKLTGFGSICEQFRSLCGLLKLPILNNRQKVTTPGTKGKPLLGSLKILNLSYCEWLRSLGSFFEFPALERLILSNCIRLIEVCESIEQCDELEHIDLSYCNEARNLVRTIGKVKNVKILNLDGCNLTEFPIEANNIVINSQAYYSAIVKVIPRDFKSSSTYLLNSLVWLSLNNNHLSNESFPVDMSGLFMLKELSLDGNDWFLCPIGTLPRLEKLSIDHCRRLTTIEHPPPTLKHLIFSVHYKLGKVVFDQDMSPIKLSGTGGEGPFIEGMFKEANMADVEEKLLHSLGWTDLDFTKIQPVKGTSEIQMLYEFGIFSTFYVGSEMPNWISHKSKGLSISFTIPSSPNNLRGLNFSFVLNVSKEVIILDADTKISNITKKRAWVYECPVFCTETPKGITYLSHWMFGKNEMENGDQITVSILEYEVFCVKECGVSFVYDEDDDGKKNMEEEEDVLGYYKSWNHIIGGDLSPFQTTTPGEYELCTEHFLGYYTGSKYKYVEESSSSLSTLDHRYDVFLSFRGFDTRSSFTDHLYNTLVSANITTFLDDEEIETGLPLKPELETAIQASRASIIVLSQNYASSTWCLDELVLILEQLSSPNYFVIPIFYHVEPTDVRKQQNNFREAMAKHNQRMEAEADAEKRSQWAQKIDLWNKALTEVAGLKGEYIAKGRKEVGFIEEIVTNIRRRLGVLLSTPQPLIIGMEYDIKNITTWLNDGSSHTADIFTISGMGGIGKTTLAKHVYRLNCGEFQRSSFIEGIGRTCAQQYNGLLDLQKQICGDISKPDSIQVRGDVFVYTSKIEKALAHKKVFVVLDDVGSLEHLDALLGNKGFHPGSKVIITTQDASLTEKYLLNLVVRPKHTQLLLEGLSDYNSLNLLSLIAFNYNDSKEGYEDVSNKLVGYCKGHPLALEVLGKALRNKDVAQWEDYIERLLKKGPLSDIKKVFQMSLESLEEDEKELFKHIACFFVGKDRESTEIILKACEFHTISGIKNLVDRSLLSIGSHNQHDQLMMHQLIQETGRDIVRQESPNRPEKRSRLWCHEESFKVLKQKKGKGNVLGLALDMRMLEKDKLCDLETDVLSKMDNLKLLQLNYVQLKGSYRNFPEELRWLCMHGFPFDHIPPSLQMENLVCLDISYSKLISLDMSYGDTQRQKLTGLGSKHKPLLRSLKILNVSYCEQLGSLGGFSECPVLERLMLSNCISLIEVCESIEQCDGLEHIDLSYCKEVGKLLRMMGKVKNFVKTLNLDGCNLSELSMEMRVDVEVREMLKGNNIGMNSQTSSSAIVEAIPRALQSNLIYLPGSLVCLSLQHNNLSNESFPKDMSSLSMLKELYLDGNDIVSLPTCMHYEFGIFSTCYQGKEIPDWISERWEGSSLSFSIPSSANILRGLNFCFVLPEFSIFCIIIKISNTTKNLTWKYLPWPDYENCTEGIITYLSHWMFGKNEMEDGDQITISVLNKYSGDGGVHGNIMMRECGISLMYDEDDDGKEEDVLGYYKSWNHIIGGDLSPFQTTISGEYYLDKYHFFGSSDIQSILGLEHSPNANEH
ncbi:LOW QUALITY PROTEIN: hypothetical protein OSB04_013512, partial [Centaurea solstitialis]